VSPAFLTPADTAPDTDRLERENGQLKSEVINLVGYIQKKKR
jgi:hypothetical protein